MIVVKILVIKLIKQEQILSRISTLLSLVDLTLVALISKVVKVSLEVVKDSLVVLTSVVVIRNLNSILDKCIMWLRFVCFKWFVKHFDRSDISVKFTQILLNSPSIYLNPIQFHPLQLITKSKPSFFLSFNKIYYISSVYQ